jgi:translocation and assembly module TamB
MPQQTEVQEITAKRRVNPVAAVVGIAILLLFIGTGVYLTSPSFNRLVRAKVIDQLEQITGGRVELKSLRWNLSKLDIEVDDLTIHGLEAPSDVPYAHFDHMTIRAKIISLLRKEIGLRYLAIKHPVIHLMVYPDGRTNQPTPKTKKSNTDPIQTVFDLAIGRAELSDGLLIYNDRKVPFNIAADKLSAGLTFTPNADLNKRQYDLLLRIGNLATDFKRGPSLVSNAETQLALRPTEADIKVLRWSSPRSRLQASGRLVNFHDPQITLSYQASINALEVARVAKLVQLRGGVLELAGKANYHGSDYAASGKLLLRDFAFRQGTTELSAINASTDYAVDPKNAELKNLRAALFGGTAQGSLAIADWSDSKRQRGRAALDVTSISVGELLSKFANSPEMRKVRVDSNTSGAIRAEWIGSPARPNATVALNFQPTGATDAIPLSGALDASYSGAKSAASISQLDLRTRGTQITAQGALGLGTSPDANVRFSIATQDLSEFTPTLAAFNVQKPPVNLHGNARIDGTATGTLALPHLLGQLAVNNFDLLVPQSTPANVPATPSAATGPKPAQSIHWDSLNTGFDYTPNAASVSNGNLRRGSATIVFNGSANLRHQVGRQMVAYSSKQIPFRASVNLRNASLKDVQSLAGYDYPLTGTLQLAFQASGTASQLSGAGNIQINDGTVYGEQFKTLQADLRLAGQDVSVPRLLFTPIGGKINAAGSYNLTSKAFTANVNGAGFDIAHIQKLQNATTHFRGQAQFAAQASGTMEAPSLNAHLQLTNLAMNKEPLGAITFDARTTGEVMNLSGRIDNQIARLTLDGNVRLRGEFPLQARVALHDFDFDPLLKLTLKENDRITGHSRVAGEITAAGPLKKPQLLTVNGNIPTLHASVENYNIDNAGPVIFSIQNQVAQFQQLHLVGDGTDIAGAGTVELKGAKALNARLNGRINLKLIQTFDPDVQSSGLTTLSVNATGTLSNPDLQGEVLLKNANFALIDLPNGLSNMNGRLVFNQNRLVVQDLTAQTGGGQLRLGGFATLGRGLFFDLTATGRDVRVRYEGMTVIGNADLTFTGTPRGGTLRGDVVINSFAMNQQFDLSLYIIRSKEPPSTPDPTSLANRVQLNVHVSSAPQLAVQTSLATLSGDVDLNVRGTALKPIVLGRVSVSEGDINFQGTKYHLERGDITFTNPTRIEPILNVAASTTIRDYDITLGFHGPIDRLSTSYRSEPPLSTADIISLLAFQRTTQEAATSQSQTSFTETAQNAVLADALNAAVSSRIQKLFGVSKVKVDPQGGGLENNKPSVTVEQSVSNKLTITFVTYPTQSNQQLIQVEYNVNKNLSIVGIRDQYGVLGIDVRLRQRRK